MTREEKKRANRRWFAIRMGVFVVAVAVFLLLMVGTECLAEAAVALTWKG